MARTTFSGPVRSDLSNGFLGTGQRTWQQLQHRNSSGA